MFEASIPWSATGVPGDSWVSLPAQTDPVVWIVILNWNGLADTLACLESLSRLDTRAATVCTLVVDNGSAVNPNKEINDRFPAVQTLRLDKNRGFAGGCNVGMSWGQERGADYILLLNNDIVVDPCFLTQLLAGFKAAPNTGIAAPLICSFDDPDRVWYAGARISFSLGYFGHRWLGSYRRVVPRGPFRTDYVTGCCMLISADVLQAIGQLDDRLFAYFEDCDYSLRAARHGFELACVPTSVVWHKGSASTRRTLREGTTSPLKHYLMARNRIAVVRRHARRPHYLFFILVSNTLQTCYLLLGFLVRRRWQKMRWLLRGVVDGIRGDWGNLSKLMEGGDLR